jgi:hypothetical protein
MLIIKILDSFTQTSRACGWHSNGLNIALIGYPAEQIPFQTKGGLKAKHKLGVAIWQWKVGNQLRMEGRPK